MPSHAWLCHTPIILVWSDPYRLASSAIVFILFYLCLLIWPRISPPGEGERVYVRVGSAGPDGGYDPGKVTSIELLGCRGLLAMTFAAVIFPVTVPRSRGH